MARGASAPWKLVSGYLGGGASAQSLAMHSMGVMIRHRGVRRSVLLHAGGKRASREGKSSIAETRALRDDCAERLNDLEKSIPTIVFSAKVGGADLSAVKVTMDGEALAERLDGTAVAVEPGEHTFKFEMAGQSPVTKKILIQQAQKDVASSSPSGRLPARRRPPVHSSTSSRREPRMGTQKVLALVAGGVGVVGVGVGAIFGLQAMSKHDEAAKVCPDRCATASDAKLWDDARSAGTISTVGFVVGGVGLAAGAVLWFTATRRFAAGERSPGGTRRPISRRALANRPSRHLRWRARTISYRWPWATRRRSGSEPVVPALRGATPATR